MQLCGGEVFGLEVVLVVSSMVKVQKNTSRMTGDMLISGGLCKVSLERLLASLRPSECINYVEQSLVLTLVFLFMVEMQ